MGVMSDHSLRHSDVSQSIWILPPKPVQISSDPNTTWVWSVVITFGVLFRHQINSQIHGPWFAFLLSSQLLYNQAGT